jgi:hypothetical protein
MSICEYYRPSALLFFAPKTQLTAGLHEGFCCFVYTCAALVILTTHVIFKNAIESVTVSEARKFTATGEPFPETKPNSQSKAARPVPRFYDLTFKISPPEGKRFSAFTQTNNQGFFETIIGKQSIGLQEFDEQFEPDEFGGLEFQYSLRDDDGSKLKELLSPFKELGIWK